MYSPLYQYFEIRSDENYSDKKSANELNEILEETGVLIKHDNLSFKNKSDFPWIEITCVNNVDNGYNSNERLAECNLLAIVTSKKEIDNEQKYLQLLTAVSAKLRWELILEEDEEGNEDVLIYKP